MSFEVGPARYFGDLATLLGPRKPTSNVCWCLSHRLPARLHTSLVGEQRARYVEKLTRRDIAPGVIAYDGDDPGAWAAVAPRSELPFARSRVRARSPTSTICRWDRCGASGCAPDIAVVRSPVP